MKIYIDGSGWNGHQATWIVLPENGRPIIKSLTEYHTNNEMEYLALIEALKISKDGDEILSDSQLIINQVLLKWAVRQESLRAYWKEALDLLHDKQVTLTWVSREENKAGRLI
jgi:ribonuclease HI